MVYHFIRNFHGYYVPIIQEIFYFFDYVHKMLIDTYAGHDGPVRSVDFYSIQPMFVSGSDDKTIKIWNYESKKYFNSL